MITKPKYKKTRIKLPGGAWFLPLSPGSAEHDALRRVITWTRQCYEHEAVVAAMPTGGDAVNLFSKGVSLARA